MEVETQTRPGDGTEGMRAADRWPGSGGPGGSARGAVGTGHG